MYVRYLTPDGGRRLLMSSVVIFAIVTMLSRSQVGRSILTIASHSNKQVRTPRTRRLWRFSPMKKIVPAFFETTRRKSVVTMTPASYGISRKAWQEVEWTLDSSGLRTHKECEDFIPIRKIAERYSHRSKRQNQEDLSVIADDARDNRATGCQRRRGN